MTKRIAVGRIEDIPTRGSRVVETALGPVALFRTSDDHLFALVNRCPHKGGPLSEGILHGHKVTCPLHNWVIDLASGDAEAPDHGCTRSIPLEVVAGVVHLDLPASAAVCHG
jgi:nitrite reductase (NADH) small subunit